MIDLKRGIGKEIHNIYNTLKGHCTDIIEEMCNLEVPLPSVKPNAMELTDGGPRVSVGNYDVKCRCAEQARIYNLDRHGRFHMCREDQGRNEEERSNAAIGNALVDGGIIDWEHNEIGDVSQLTWEQYKECKETISEKNAWYV